MERSPAEKTKQKNRYQTYTQCSMLVFVKSQGQSYRLSFPLTLMPVIVALQRAKAEISWPLDYDLQKRQHCHTMGLWESTVGLVQGLKWTAPVFNSLSLSLFSFLRPCFVLTGAQAALLLPCH
jgi:hypothetical protein